MNHIFSLLEALSTGSAFGREQKKRRGHRPAGGKNYKVLQTSNFIETIII